MICFPNAKINLGLHVTARRQDGYHDIETVFYPIPLCDALEITPADKWSFEQTGIALDAPSDDNLVMKALRCMQQRHQIPASSVFLHKAVPVGAGLGGGSSDASFMLKLLNDYAELNIPDNELETMAASLGADCPFFVRNTPVVATGTGNVFCPVDVSLKDYTICIVKPDIAVSTREAYSLVKPAMPPRPLSEVVSLPVEQWREVLVNDFEPSIFRLYPQIEKIKNELYERGAVYAAMSGSGSAVFGLFKDEPEIKSPYYYVWKGKMK
ncbi:MAG: 4-(cytidine 5'-diphospho)-2-C-methyl-D-erythritol kinase [Tannerella sp.]|jgi:4-diphosphocytidyl-2-C-methyl-D-erythritol kinase|nr:4-(cytidine 5'-diphospho)-2-C-methyl-D-erythritol kinase [Tannerella sp.]